MKKEEEDKLNNKRAVSFLSTNHPRWDSEAVTDHHRGAKNAILVNWMSP